ncbi:MAG: tetratricopeptide repeat protein [Deltaproteobacteria bacterium]|nr:MAG: tetratricopeptide repeat protein [Deltaproteobacteria bacterium]
MTNLASILADVRSLANRGAHHAIVQRYGALDDTPEEETWNSTELLFEIGRAFGMLGNEEKVERYLLRCAELAPRRAAVFHCAIGWYFQRKKKWTKALRWYDRALASFPTYHLCLFRRGYCLEKLHRPRETVDALSRAREIWEKAPIEQRQRGRGVQVQVLFHLSRALRDLGEFDGAADALDSCCELDRGSDPPAIRPEHVLANRGELDLRRGDLAAAAAAFRAARDLDPASSYLCERLGRVHELAGDMGAAETAYREAAALPRGAFAYLALGRFQARVTGDLPGAVAALVEALRRVPAAEPLVRVELARIELAVGRRTAALRQVERALACRREGGFAEGLRLASDLCEQLGRGTDARRYLEQLGRLTPGDPEIAERAAALAGVPGPMQDSPPSDPVLPPELAALGDAPVEAPRDQRLAGTVDRFFPEKGFGFLRYGSGESIFFHVTQCEDGADGIEMGTRVTFVLGHNAKKGKPQAEGVRRAE